VEVGIKMWPLVTGYQRLKTMVIKKNQIPSIFVYNHGYQKLTIPIDDIEPWFSNVFRKNQIPALKLL
jgi:hypothetical protein